MNSVHLLNGVEFIFFLILLVTSAKHFGRFMTKVFSFQKTIFDPILAPVEKTIYKLCIIDNKKEQTWSEYTISFLILNLLGFLFLYLILRNQGSLPLNPNHIPSLSSLLAFNLAVSFITNTNWQSVSPETSISYFTEFYGLTVQNYLSAASGIAISIGFMRAFTVSSKKTLGNFWVDLTRTVLWVLLPLSFIVAIFFASQGVIQNLNPNLEIRTLEGYKEIIFQGPVASRESIKMIGTNGGGIFNANSAHPFENPTPLTNLIQIYLLLLIGASLTFTFGDFVKDKRQGISLLSAMLILFSIGVFITYTFEFIGNPLISKLGGNMEGKEVRFGIFDSSLFAVATTAASCGAVNSMHDSFTPLAGMIPLINIMLGEIIIGGVGAGLYGILLFAILTVFLSGLMVGRTPEYLGKKIESKEIKLAILAILILPIVIHCFTALACTLPMGNKSILNPGPHGFSEILYAFSSAVGNNGSAFGGLNTNTFFYNLTTGIAMLIGRFLSLIPTMAIAGSLASKKVIPPSSGTLPTYGPLFVFLLIGVILIVGGLIYFPALSLGPIVEHFQMLSGKVY